MDKDESVGYGKPPKKFQFKKGQSGNPAGRKKNQKPQVSLQDSLLKELFEYMPVRIDGENKQARKIDVLVKAIYNHAIQGNMQAARLIERNLPHPSLFVEPPRIIIMPPNTPEPPEPPIYGEDEN